MASRSSHAETGMSSSNPGATLRVVDVLAWVSRELEHVDDGICGCFVVVTMLMLKNTLSLHAREDIGGADGLFRVTTRT